VSRTTSGARKLLIFQGIVVIADDGIRIRNVSPSEVCLTMNLRCEIRGQSRTLENQLRRRIVSTEAVAVDSREHYRHRAPTVGFGRQEDLEARALGYGQEVTVLQTGVSRPRATNSITAFTCSRSSLSYHARMSSIFAPASRFSKIVATAAVRGHHRLGMEQEASG
jgi:hypothetical protein